MKKEMIKRENFGCLVRKLGTLGKKLLATSEAASTKIIIFFGFFSISLITSALALFSNQSFKFISSWPKEELVDPCESLF